MPKQTNQLNGKLSKSNENKNNDLSKLCLCLYVYVFFFLKFILSYASFLCSKFSIFSISILKWFLNVWSITKTWLIKKEVLYFVGEGFFILFLIFYVNPNNLSAIEL